MFFIGAVPLGKSPIGNPNVEKEKRRRSYLK